MTDANQNSVRHADWIIVLIFCIASWSFGVYMLMACWPVTPPLKPIHVDRIEFEPTLATAAPTVAEVTVSLLRMRDGRLVMQGDFANAMRPTDAQLREMGQWLIQLSDAVPSDVEPVPVAVDGLPPGWVEGGDGLPMKLNDTLHSLLAEPEKEPTDVVGDMPVERDDKP